MTDPNYNTPVKDLVYKDLLTRTFTLASHDRGMKTWSVLVSYPECVFFRNKFRYELYSVECQMDPNIGKVTTGKERTVASCKESLPTSRGPHRNRFLEIQTEIRSHIIGRVTERLSLQKRLQRQNGTCCVCVPRKIMDHTVTCLESTTSTNISYCVFILMKYLTPGSLEKSSITDHISLLTPASMFLRQNCLSIAKAAECTGA